MFSAMMEGIKEESVGNLFNLQVEVQENPIVEEAANGAAAPAPTGTHAKPGGPGGAHAKPATDGDGQASGAAQPAAGPQPPAARSRRSRAAGRGRASAAPRAGAPAPATPPGDGPVVAPGLQRPKRPAQLQYSAPSADGPGEVEQRGDRSSADPFSRVGRNDMCPCGSGRKYKRCHGDPRNRSDG